MNPEMLQALARLAEQPERDDIVNALSIEILKRRMQETFDVLTGKQPDYLLIFVDPDTGHAATLTSLSMDEAIDLTIGWLRAHSDNDED